MMEGGGWIVHVSGDVRSVKHKTSNLGSGYLPQVMYHFKKSIFSKSTIRHSLGSHSNITTGFFF